MIFKIYKLRMYVVYIFLCIMHVLYIKCNVVNIIIISNVYFKSAFYKYNAPHLEYNYASILNLE